ncbi:hypothetical protein GOODEAATRI_014253 [Goodea atripinnis]|uniref:Uncharacterized protein n=1 Tax=Goodea atripinnis TaxID=208336 RepID=A0ABV0PY19_9TELE
MQQLWSGIPRAGSDRNNIYTLHNFFIQCTHSTLTVSGNSAAAGALSSPMLEQLTTQSRWGPAGAQLQLTGQGLQLPPPSPCGPEPHTSRQQSATSRPGKKPYLGTQTPCSRLDKVCVETETKRRNKLVTS